MVFVLVAVYFWYTQFRTVNTSESSTVTDQNQLLGRQFVLLVNKLKAISIDSSFFSSEKFTSLMDLTPTIEIPEKFGRENPFARIGDQ